MSFVHLHAYSDYSLLHGAARVKALVSKAKASGMDALALTDQGNLFGAIEFYLACRSAGVRPILGIEAYVARDRHEHNEAGGKGFPLVLLAENETGWRNLMKIASVGYLEGLHGRPRIDREVLREYSGGLIALSGGRTGEIESALAEGNMPLAEQVAQEYVELFGSENFFLELQNHAQAGEARVRTLAAQLGQQMGLRLVATNSCMYLDREHAPAHDVLLAISQGTSIDDPTRFSFDSHEYYFKSADEMVALFPDFPDAVENARVLADRCHVELELGKLLLPEFPLPAGYDEPDDYLSKLADEGALRRYGGIDTRVRERLDYELGVIRGMGFAGYFLITGDFVQAARDRGIPVGPGRGSAAGSLVCYCTGITDVDPLEHDLLFERFLNPERISMPDIDIDFCFERRDEIIDFVIQKYGKGNVCQIITYGTMLARGVIRDVGRALGLSYGEVDRIAKMVPEQLGITLKKALEDVEELRAVREEDPRYDRLIHTARELEGLHRHSSIHAAGILIAPGDLTDHVPLHKSNKSELTTQWDMKMVEEVGLLKMDFLGLRTLTVIEKALENVAASGGPTLTASEIPMDDPAVYELLTRGETVGIFQLESSGMQEILRKLKPGSFDEVTAVNALYRPGPLGSGMVDDFIACKHGQKAISYAHPMLEPILNETYGVILYQEQVMRIAGDMARFTMGEADTLRKAMGKKKVDVMEQMKLKFIEGSTKNDVKAKTAEQIFDLMAFFAGYGFNKSHSASYAVLSVQTAWLKTHHPAAFMAATLTTEMGNTTRVVTLLSETRRLGIAVLPPDVNTCTTAFKVVDGAVRFGLGAVKNVGRGAIEAIVEARDELGRGFRSLYEFCEEIDLSRVNRRVIESLVLAGALDALGGRREQKLAALDLALARAQRRARDRDRGQASLFGGGPTSESADDDNDGVLPNVAAWTETERLRRERELVGFYVSGHPLDQHRPLLHWIRPQTTGLVSALADETPVVLCGVMSSLKTVTTRKTGRLMAFVGVEDFDGVAEAMCFSEAYETHRTTFNTEDIFLFMGRASSREEDDESKLVLEKVMKLDDACRSLVHRISVQFSADIGRERVDALMKVVAAHPGRCPLVFEVVADGGFQTSVVARRAAVDPTADFLGAMVRLFGSDSVRPDVRSASSLLPPQQGRSFRRRGAASAQAPN